MRAHDFPHYSFLLRVELADRTRSVDLTLANGRVRSEAGGKMDSINVLAHDFILMRSDCRIIPKDVPSLSLYCCPLSLLAVCSRFRVQLNQRKFSLAYF